MTNAPKSWIRMNKQVMEDFNMETRKVLRNFKESDLWDFLKKISVHSAI